MRTEGKALLDQGQQDTHYKVWGDEDFPSSKAAI